MRPFEPVRYITIGGQKLPKDISDDVAEFSYEDTADKMDELRLTILDAGLTHIDDPLLQEGKEICARWGYIGELTDVRRCTIKEIDYSFPEDGCPTITLVAYDKGHKLTGRSSRECWSNKKIADIVKSIASKHSLKAQVEVPEDAPREFTAQGGKNDFEFLQQLADECGCSFKVKNNTLIFTPETETNASLAVEYRRDGSGWLKNVSINCDSENGKGASVDTEVSGVDAATGKEFSEKATSAESKILVNMNTGAQSQETKLQERSDEAGKRTVSSAANAQEAIKTAKSAARNAVKDNITMTADFIGIPWLEAKKVITITGIGKKFSGNWKIKSVTHTISADAGYTCNAELTKNDVAKPPSSGGGKTQPNSTGKAKSPDEKSKTRTVDLKN